jgi:signal peptidase I
MMLMAGERKSFPGQFLGRFRYSTITRRYVSKGGRTQQQQPILSRTERRKLERKDQNRINRLGSKSKTSNRSKPSATTATKDTLADIYARVRESSWWLQWSEQILKSSTLRIPLEKERMGFEQWIALAYRLPLILVLGYVFTDENISPYVIRASFGPSMLPTIQFVGDIWLVETGAWRRAWKCLWEGQDAPIDTSSYQVGDLVLWKDPKTGRISCKRIVGLEGEKVKTYGAFVELYKNRPDLGIVWPRDASTRGIPSKDSFLEEVRHVKNGPDNAIHQRMVIPANHMWVEGDCPLFSVDSRHYGPIPTSTLLGKLVLRLWPWNRVEMIHDNENAYVSSCRVFERRPIPYSSEEPYLGKKFGLYKVVKESRAKPTEESNV